MSLKSANDKKYVPSEIEKKWQEVWENQAVFSPDLDNAKKPFYNLMMFPYPSAEGLHAGNMYAFTGADIRARFMRMKGYDVFEPIGLDGFGIHSENYALKTGMHPMEQAEKSEKNFYRQLHSIGNSFDWNRTVETYDPNYYKWTQWIFIQMFKKGLAYRKKSLVNWCPSCKTVLADEQVIKKLKVQSSKLKVEISVCERCETEVIKKELEQWFFKITEYAERLLNNIPKLNWTEKVKIAQTQWIGKSEGSSIEFPIKTDENFVLLHGYTGSSKVNFFPWIKKLLESRGFVVFAPDLPHSDDPDIIEQVKFVEKNYKFNQNTVLFGHSLGSVVALKIAERLNEPIKKLVLAAGFAEPKFLDRKRPFEEKFDWNFDFEKIKKNVKEIIFLRAKNDTAVPKERAEYLKEKLGGRIVDFVAKEDHVCGEKEPVVLDNLISNIEVFTTRPDTLYGATFLVISPEHPIVSKILDWQTNISSARKQEILEYVDAAKKKSDLERVAEDKQKTGIFSGVYAVNPVTKKEIPIWIADYVLMGYGTGAIMAVPAHDQRDYEFAKKYDLPIKIVIASSDIIGARQFQEIASSSFEKFKTPRNDELEGAYIGGGEIIDSGEWSGWKVPQDVSKVIKSLEDKGFGKKDVHYHLRDWLISRQRYWGPPIPIIYCSKCWEVKSEKLKVKSEYGKDYSVIEGRKYAIVAVEEKNLPVKLPYIEDYKPIGTGKSPLATHPEFYNTKCPNCRGEAVRETDVSDTFLDSAWYFFRYLSTEIENEPFRENRVNKWLPVDIYIGGAEHSVLHLLYSRFMTMFFHDLGLIDFEEPYNRFFAHGLLIKEGAKMSKSKGNVVVPDAYIAKLGADTIRCYLMFLGPFSQGGDFYDTGIEGMNRFLKRVWTLFQVKSSKLKVQGLEINRLRMMHKTIKKVTEDIDGFRYNTAIAALMEYYNFLVKQKDVSKEEVENYLKLLAPFAPHITEELYQSLEFKLQNSEFSSIHLSKWPDWEEKMLEEDEVLIVVQVNGKARDTIKVENEKLKIKSYVEEKARRSEKVVKFLEGKDIKTVVYVPGKIINFVIGN